MTPAIDYSPDRRLPWRVTYTHGGKFVRRFFATEAGAKNFLRAQPGKDKRTAPIATPDQFKAIMRAAAPEHRGVLALAFLAGLRIRELEEMTPDCIDLVGRRIVILDRSPLRRQARILTADALPPVLFDWLTKFPFRQNSWKAAFSTLRKHIAHWSPGYTRNTAVAYMAARHGRAAAAMLDAHPSLFSRVFGVGVDAERYYAIGPDSLDSQS